MRKRLLITGTIMLAAMLMAGQAHATLVGHWKLDEESGTTVLDETSTHDGTNYGALVNQTGEVGKAYYFNGAESDYVLVADDDAYSVNTTGKLSASLWLKTGSDVSTRQSVVAKGADGSGNYEWNIDVESSKLRVHLCDSSGWSIRR